MVKKYILVFVLTLCVPAFVSASDDNVSVSIQGENLGQMTVTVEYELTPTHRTIPILYPSSPDQMVIFESAKSDAGIVYDVTTNSQGEYVISSQSNDKRLYVKYKLKNQISSSDIGFYSFLLIYEKEYSKNVTVKTVSAQTDIISPHMYTQWSNKATSTFSLPAPDVSERYRSITIPFIAISKGKYAPYEIKKIEKYVLVAPKNKNTQIVNAIKGISFSDQMFKTVFGKQIENTVLITVTPFSKLNTIGKGASGLTLNPHRIVFIDTTAVSFQKSLLYLKKVLIHELTHVLHGSLSGIQEGQSLSWINEGLAVFSDIYASENYFYPKSSLIDRKNIPMGSRLLTQTEKQKIYTQEIDFNTDRDTIERPRPEIYSHLGTIFYNYFKLKNSIVDFTSYITACGVTCTNADILSWMIDKSKLTKNQLLYPN